MNSKEENEFKNSLQDLVYDQTLECKKNVREAIPGLLKNSENMKKVAKKAADTASNMPDKVNVQNKSKIPEAQKGLDDDD